MREAKSNCDLKTKVDFSYPYILTLVQGKPPKDPRRRPMDLVHRAKIFAPFNALEGYSDLIKEVDRSFDEPERENWEPNICQFWDDP